MSDKVELIAAAQVNAFAGPPSGIEFNSNYGFKTASRGSDGVYTLELDHDHGAKKLVMNVTPIGTAGGQASASVLTKDTIQVTLLDSGGVAADSPFSITIDRVRD